MLPSTPQAITPKFRAWLAARRPTILGLIDERKITDVFVVHDQRGHRFMVRVPGTIPGDRNAFDIGRDYEEGCIVIDGKPEEVF